MCRSTLIFQAPMLETNDSLVLLLTVCWGFPMLQQTGFLGPQLHGVNPYIASALHQQSPSGLGCMPRYTLAEKQQSLIGCAPRYRAFHNGGTELNPPPSTQVGWPGLGGDHTLISVACWFLTAVVLSGLSKKYSLGLPPPRQLRQSVAVVQNVLVIMTSHSMLLIPWINKPHPPLTLHPDHHQVLFHLNPLWSCLACPTIFFSFALISAPSTASGTFHFLPDDTSGPVIHTTGSLKSRITRKSLCHLKFSDVVGGVIILAED